MKITKNLVYFSIINAVSSVVFLIFLEKGILTTRINNEPNPYVTTLPIIYATIWFVSGILCGGLDTQRKSRYNLGFAYHMATVFIVLIATIFGFIYSKTFRNLEFIITPLVLSVSLLIHWLIVRNNIKGIDKKQAFK